MIAGQHAFNGYVAGKPLAMSGLHMIEIDYFQVRKMISCNHAEPRPLCKACLCGVSHRLRRYI